MPISFLLKATLAATEKFYNRLVIFCEVLQLTFKTSPATKINSVNTKENICLFSNITTQWDLGPQNP